ncbi:MAG: bifunctional folylpolyglutamate synthase/dihydrofolate synthase, partial [Candidatus Omnitrophica bacterium]|nr:bifunctional folylpolyglutamate synthase/dihydrofolate synthase [Candidatus Omnitrophota bacterium]
LQYLNSLENYENNTNYAYENLQLERVETLLEKLDNPQHKFKSIHIAGTKGKGSTCAYIFSILKEAGYKVGLYTSPHLIDFKERIKISYQDEMEEAKGRLIEQHELVQLVEEIKPLAEKIPGLTFFEVVTVIAFLFFARKNMDFVVLETGLGGRLDATNVVRPLVCGLTNISLDHTALLGNTVEKIAREKAGIIKKNGLVVTVSQVPQAWKEINDVCKKKNARLYEIGKDFIFDVIGHNLDGSIFDFRGIFDSYQNLHIPLIGQFQLTNAALALGIIHVLRLHDIVISSYAVKKGLEKTHWPGRMHLIHRNPFFVLDGAQNPDSAHALRAAINMLFIPRKSILVLGVSNDKDVEGICRHLARQQNLIILTESNSPRALNVDALEKRMPEYQRVIKKTKRVYDALKMAVENISSRDDLVIVAGSLYLVGEAYTVLKEMRIPDFE